MIEIDAALVRQLIRTQFPQWGEASTWERARGWAIWKALITLIRHRDTNPIEARKAAQIIQNVLDDHSL